MKTKLLMSVLFLLSAMFCMSVFAKSKNEQALDKTVAIVNDDVITKSEFNHALALAKMQISQGGLPTPATNVLDKQVLDQLVNKKLQLQIAKQAGVHISDVDLNSAIEHIANQNNVSVSTLYQRLTQEGMQAADYRDEIRDQMTLQKLQQQEVISHINVTPQEVNGFMRSQIWQTNGAKEYRIEDILIPVADEPTSQELLTAKKQAQVILTKLNQGEDFRKLAQIESKEDHALEGGDLGFRKLPEIPSAFAEHITRMQIKEVAGPIQTANGFHIIRLADVRALDGGHGKPDRKQVENLLLQRKFEEAMQTWVSKLRGQAFIQITPEKT